MISKKLSKAFAKASTAFVLVVMITISCFSAVAVNSNVLSTGATFGANSDIYLDLNGQNWESSGAKIGAYFYYNDNKNWCYQTNNGDYAPGNMSGKKDQTIGGYSLAEKVADGIYKITVPNMEGSLGAVTFVRVSSDNKLWGYTAQMTADSKGSNNCVKLNGYENNSSWSYYNTGGGSGTVTPPATGESYNYVVPADSKMKNNKDLFIVNATYYDYWSDNERSQGKYQENEGDYNDLGKWWYQLDDFNMFVSDYAKQHTSWTFPLYFGNMYKGDHYDLYKQHTVDYDLRNITGIDGTKWEGSEYYAINNSNGMYWYNNKSDSSYHQPLQGLVGKSLDADGDIVAADGTTKLPYFYGKLLANAEYDTDRASKKVATVLKSAFPFKTEKISNGKVTRYSFSSKNAKDNVYFTWENRVPKTIKYGAGDGYGVHDALSKFGGSGDGYGLFPFNNNSNHLNSRPANNELDYGFGVRLDIDFRVPEGGLLPDGSDCTFNFTGDDDLWVYLGEKADGSDGKLVLDLAGDHKEAKGRINFRTMRATAENVFADYSNGTASIKNADVKTYFNGSTESTKNYLDPGKTYHMTVFYMERGESESNFSVDFTMTPLKNTFKVDNKVDASEVSSQALQTYLENLDNFNYKTTSTVDTPSGKTYTYTDGDGKTSSKTVNSSSIFGLKNDNSAFFNDQFTASTSDTSNNMGLTETPVYSTNLSLDYDTSWVLYDIDKPLDGGTYKVISKSTAGQDVKASTFNYINSDTDYGSKTDLWLSYLNKIHAYPITINKTVLNPDGTEATDDNSKNAKFDIKVILDVNANGQMDDQPYDLDYQVAGDNNTYKLDADGIAEGLSVNTPVTILGVPEGVGYWIVEQDANGYNCLTDIDEYDVSSDTNTVEITNQIVEAKSNLSISKTVDGKKYNGQEFEFTQTPLVQAQDGSYAPEEDTNSNDTRYRTTTLAENGVVEFQNVRYNLPGTYYYAITEGYNGSGTSINTDYQVNNSVVMAKVVIENTGDTVVPQYANYDSATIQQGGYVTPTGYNYTKLVADFDSHKASVPTIANKTTTLRLNVTKSEGLKDEDNDGQAELVNPIKGANFCIYAVDSEDSELTNVVAYGISGDDGTVQFYKDQEHKVALTDLSIYKSNSGVSELDYQMYAIKETSAAPGYVLNDTVQYVTLDTNKGVIVPAYKSSENAYYASVGFVNNLITVPFTGLTVTYTTFYVGLTVIVLSMVLGAYLLLSRRKKTAYVSRHGR